MTSIHNAHNGRNGARDVYQQKFLSGQAPCNSYRYCAYCVSNNLKSEWWLPIEALKVVNDVEISQPESVLGISFENFVAFPNFIGFSIGVNLQCLMHCCFGFADSLGLHGNNYYQCLLHCIGL